MIKESVSRLSKKLAEYPPELFARMLDLKVPS